MYAGREASIREAVYLAAYLDGEGCFEKAGSAKISVSNTHLPTLEHFQKLYAGTIRKKTKSKPHWRQAWEWSVCGDNARNVAALVFPFLREKQPQAYLLTIAHTFPAKSERRISIEQELKDLKRVEWLERS